MAGNLSKCRGDGLSRRNQMFLVDRLDEYSTVNYLNLNVGGGGVTKN